MVKYPGFRIRNKTLIEYTGAEENVVIPPEVTKIGEKAFYKCKSLKSAVIPGGVRVIEKSAFSGCSNLKSVSFSRAAYDGQTGASANASPFSSFFEFYFGSPDSAAKSESGLAEISAYAFYGCESLEKFDMPKTVKTIGACAFKGCGRFKEIALPDGAVNVAKSAFNGSTKAARDKTADSTNKNAGGNSSKGRSADAELLSGIDENKLNSLLEELNSLIGLKGVKDEINLCIDRIKINKLRKKKGMKESPVSNHLVFTGNPGTGKTTVARIIAKIYKVLGVVSRGNFVETDRSGLVAEYVGQTAPKTKAVINRALGGVLFIDEAYSLFSPSDSKDFGKEAVDTLVKEMEDRRDNLVVIVAGYKKEMKTFIGMNTGLSSRFTNYIDFADYSGEEMLEILKGHISDAELILSEKAGEAALNYLKTKEGDAEFGNGRGVRNYFAEIFKRQGSRVLKDNKLSDPEFRTVEKQDVVLE